MEGIFRPRPTNDPFMNTDTRAAAMPRDRTQITLGVLLLFVACVGVYLRVLAIVVEHRREIAMIWEQFLWRGIPGP